MALVLVEGELWPAWISAAERRQIPVALVSGRISARSFARYHRLPRRLRRTFARLSAVGAGSQEDAERLLRLGAGRERVRITGDLKLESATEVPEASADLVARIPEPCLVAGSTHPGEEAVVGRALLRANRDGAAWCAVIAPRRIERAQEVEAELRELGIRVLLRTGLQSGERLEGGQVLLLDTLGELAGVYRLGLRAFVGGTLVPVGGHNLVEPLHAGTPVIFGPHTESARDAAQLLLDSGAGERVQDAASIAAILERDLADPADLTERITRGRARLAEHRGSLERSVALVEGLVRGDNGASEASREAGSAPR